MAIDSQDYALIYKYREKFPEGDSCAILGDCSIWGDFKDLGFKRVDTFDILGNPTYKVDLNEPLDSKYLDKYDWVIDSGTLYCCFNPAMVLKNMTDMIKDKGCCLHTSNLCGWFGRGFYSVSPSLYKEFYELNNFTIEGMGTKTKMSGLWHDIDINSNYLKSADYGSVLFSEDPSPFVEALPNDTLLHCFVSRKERVEYQQPVPEHYVKTDGK
tara:strand:+ start:13134 stop:13772 length:639 start_codon:yes stop_codon:yes gene_type:complete